MESRPRWLVFDIGNVVARGDERICRGILRCLGVPYLNTSKIYSCSEYYEFLRGNLSPKEFYQILRDKYLHYPVTFEQVANAYSRSMYALDHGVVEILESLDRRSLAFLTDTNVWQEQNLARLVDLTLFSDHIFESHKIHRVKTDEDCFPFVVSQLGAEPGEILLIDDSAEKVEIANYHGLRTFHFMDSDRLAAYLRSMGWLI